MRNGIRFLPCMWIVILFAFVLPNPVRATERLRIIIETDAGGDPDDEQSLVRFLLYTNEWDVEGIICTLAKARDKENLNPERNGLGIVRRQLKAYGDCHANLVKHDRRFPNMEYLWKRAVAGYDGAAGMKLILAAADAADQRPIWFCNWGTGHDSDESSFKQALTMCSRNADRPVTQNSSNAFASAPLTSSANTPGAIRPGRSGWIRFGPSWRASAGITAFPH